MSITNGFDVTSILPVMIQRKGWETPLSGAPVIDSTNQTCKSGKYFTGHHPAVSIAAIKAVQEYSAIDVTQFNALLLKMNKEVCLDVLNKVFYKPVMVDKPQISCEKEECAQVITGTKGNRFVGIKIKVADGDYAVQLHNLVLLFDAVATFNVHLYHDLKKAPLWSKEVVTEAGSQVTVALDEKIIHANGTPKGGVYYLGYFEADLGTAKALEYSARDWEEFSLIGLEGVETTYTGTDINKNNPSYTDLTYGLTVELSSYHDYTNTIIQRISDFDDVIGDMMVQKVIEMTMFNQRSNSTQRRAEANNAVLYTELNQEQATEESPYSPGVRNRIRKSIKQLQETFYKKPGIIITTPC